MAYGPPLWESVVGWGEGEFRELRGVERIVDYVLIRLAPL
jgi:hypothetical protein